MSECQHLSRTYNGDCEECAVERERARIVAAIRKLAKKNAPDRYYTAEAQRNVADWIEKGCPDE